MRRRFFLVVALVVLAVPASALAGPGYSMKLGSTFTITGRTGSDTGKHTHALGKVVLSGRFGIERWRVLDSTTTDSTGRYRFAFTPRRRGDLTLRVAPPDHHPRLFVLHVR